MEPIELCGDYRVYCREGSLADLPPGMAEQAVLFEQFGTSEPGPTCICAVWRTGNERPLLIVLQRAPSAWFPPNVLVVPETDRLFLGVGERLLGYDLLQPARLWEDATMCGMYDWTRHGDVILMSAELELAAWDITGRKLWSAWAEPPWHYTVEGAAVVLDVMGAVSRFDLRTGPRREPTQGNEFA
jgi:hypothetical protein